MLILSKLSFFSIIDFLQDIQMDDPYTEHTLTFDQLSDIYPLSRLNCKKLNKSRGLNQVFCPEKFV